MVKLVWSLVALVLLIGVVRLAMIYSDRHSPDQKILMDKSRQ